MTFYFKCWEQNNLIILRPKIVSWFKSNLRDFCTSINKNRCWFLSRWHFADKEKKRKEACASRRRTAVKHAVMRTFLSHCVRDQKRGVICFRKLHSWAHRHSFHFPQNWRHGLRLDLRPIYAQIYSHSFRNICLNIIYLIFTYLYLIFKSFIPFHLLFIFITNKLINIMNI